MTSMTKIVDHITINWLSSGLLGIALLVVLAVALLRNKLADVRRPLLIIALVIALPALGGLVVSETTGWWLAVIALACLGACIAALLLSGYWQQWFVIGLGGLLLVGVGGMWMIDLQYAVRDGVRILLSLEFVHPWWLLLLLILPIFIFLAARSLYFPDLNQADRRLFWRRVLPAFILPPVGLLLLGWYVARSWRRLRMESYRPWVALALRCLLVVFLTLALAEPRLLQTSDTITVLFVVDRSQSIPEELVDDPANPGARKDQRLERLLNFINDGVQKRGAGHERDRAGLIVFGRRPRLELPPSDAPRFNLDEIPTPPDGHRTDIAAAIKLAMASFPQDSGKRVVLISDGNQNLGDLEAVAREAKLLGVQIDVLPVAPGQKNENEILVERVEAPPVTEQGSKVPIRVLVRSHNPQRVIARLTVKQITEKERDVTIVMPNNRDLGARVERSASGGVRIGELMPDSVLARAGVEAGQDIIKIDHVVIEDPLQFARIIGNKEPGKAVSFVIRRDPVKLIVDTRVALQLGLNPFSFTRPLTDEQRSYTYEAEVQPLRIEDREGNVVVNLDRNRLPGDRVQNNRASAHVVARGQRRILILEDRGERPNEVVHDLLAQKLEEAGERKFLVDVQSVEVLKNYPDPTKLAVFLGDYDCVILANVPADEVSEEQREAIRSNTHDQGSGLIMIGGPQSFGSGGWQSTAVEKALPVDCEIRSLKVQTKSGLVMIMHACEMSADANFWQKRIAQLAVDRLGPADEVGIIDFDWNTKWPVPMQEVGPNRGKILAGIDKMMPGDMLDFEPAFQMAHKELTDPEKNFGKKHVIVISDGDPQWNPATMQKFRADKISVTTVGIATHGPNEDQKMATIAQMTGGRAYSVKNANQLPAIYIRESRLVSQSFVHERQFTPQVVIRGGPTEKLPDPVPDLYGYVRTTPKDSPLVVTPILTPKFNEQEFPVLAYWHYGLGKGVAFTSDAGNPKFWSRDWVAGGVYAKFWEQVVDWSLRPTESSRMAMFTEARDGKVRIVVEARDQDGKLDPNLTLRGGISIPGETPDAKGQRRTLTFVQKNTGQYEAEVKAEESGSYFITAQATRKVKVLGPDGVEREVEEGVDSVRAGLTLPYSPEFADLETDVPLLKRIAEITEGRVYGDDADELAAAINEGALFRTGLPRRKSHQPLWYWLLFLTCILLLFDIAVRRIAMDLSEVRRWMRNSWARLRGLPVEEGRQEYFARLQSRKSRLIEHLASDRASRRFEADPHHAGSIPTAADAGAPPSATPTRPPAAGGPPAPPTPGAPAPRGEDFADRLARAKKKVWEERDEGKKEEK